MTARLLPLASIGLMAVAATAPASAQSAPRRALTGQETFLLAIHNSARVQVGVRPLYWDPALAAGARAYAYHLARTGILAHSPRASRPGQSENLWMGTRGGYSQSQMVGSWLAERRNFVPGTFPHVSRTGSWVDVSHYTQMIWPSTRAIGCGIASGARWDYLVCRYSPKGNIDGRRVP